MLENVAKLLPLGQIDERTASKAMEAGRGSAEEITQRPSAHVTAQELPTIQFDGDQDSRRPKKMIQGTRNLARLIEVSQSFDSSQLYTREQKVALQALINAQVDIVDNPS
jgi:hypothetical protein